jgi:hypothetical protein
MIARELSTLPSARILSPTVFAALCVLAGACTKKEGSAADAATAVLRVGAPLIRPAELRQRPGPGYFVAASLLSGGAATWRGWLHVPIAAGAPMTRLPDAWKVPYDASLAAARDASAIAFVTRDGRVGLARFESIHPDAGRGPVILASDAQPGVAPVFLDVEERFVYARHDGAIVSADAKGVRVLWAGGGHALVAVARSAAGDRLVSSMGGESILVTEVATGRTHVAYRARGERTRLFDPRLLRDGTLLVRERRGRQMRLLRVPPAGGGHSVVTTPVGGALRSLAVARGEDRAWFGVAERGAGVQVGTFYEGPLAALGARGDGGAASPRFRAVASFERTLPLAHVGCDERGFAVVDERTPLARLVFVDAESRQRFLTPEHVRLRVPESVAAVCSASR